MTKEGGSGRIFQNSVKEYVKNCIKVSLEGEDRGGGRHEG